MKLFITTTLALFLATASVAEPLLIVNPGSEEGAFRQVLTDVSENLEHNFVQANTPNVASTYFNKSNVLTVWSSEWPSNLEFTSPNINSSNLVALMTYETMICSKEYKSLSDMAGKKVKIATWGSVPVANFLTKLGQELGTEFVVVPYDGSGSTVKGYVGGDADTIFTITSRQAAVEESADSNCFAFSASGDINFKFVDAVIAINANEATINDLRSIMAEKSMSADWAEKFAGTTFYIASEDASDLINTYKIAVKNFTQ